MALNIGIEASALGFPHGGGVRTFLYYALRELATMDERNQFVLYTTPSVRKEVLPPSLDGNARWRLRPASGIAARKPILWLQTGLNRACAQDKLDLLWITCHISPLFQRRIPLVSTVFDLFYYRVPQAFPFYFRMLNKLFAEDLVGRSRKIIATSRATARDLIEIMRVDPKRIEVAYGGVDREIFRPRSAEEAYRYTSKHYNLNTSGKPFILASDVYNRRKNFVTLLRAYSSLPTELQHQFDIVATGKPMKYHGYPDLQGTIQRLGLTRNVHLIGYVEHQDMPWLYSAASLLVFPSFYEGFGLPVIEAMACGCPVITSTVSSMPEAAGAAALLADPDNPEQFAHHIKRVLTEQALAQDLREKGTEHAKLFTWRAFAETVLYAMRSAAGSDGR